MKLIYNWRQAWRMLSVQIPTVNVAFLSTWAALPAKFQDAVPLPWAIGTAVALMVLGIAGRLIDQPKVRE